MQTYIYNSEIGTFEIRQTGHKRYELWIEYELIGSYDNAVFAADDVANFDTDYIEWDKFENELQDFPSDLSKWAKVKEEAPQ